MSINQSFYIKSGQEDYQVQFFENVPGLLQEIIKPGADYRFVVDENVFKLYEEPLTPVVNPDLLYLVPANEEEKTLAGVERFLTWLQETKSNKATEVVAIGGGIIQDIVTFSTKIYYRGIKWHFVPTTLLSMGDSCIGAKCGVNLNQFKNQIGVFNSPSSIGITSKFCETLSDDDLLSGHGEILKLSLTESIDQYNKYKTSMLEFGARTPDLNDFIYSCLNAKKKVIEADEYESDLRRIMNYGHTYGHAIEALTNHGVPHGTAVAYGIDIVNYFSLKDGLISKELFMDVHTFIRNVYPAMPSVTSEDLIRVAKTDKKVVGNSVNLALLTSDRGLIVQNMKFDDNMKAYLDEYLTGYRSDFSS